jgi:aspartate kinase
VAGYQGVSYRKEVTTLGRGGSDTTAVALAAALDAEACEIYSDVAGVYTADPRVVPAARRLAEISYEEMQELAEHGARVLNAQAVEFAKDRGIAIYARATSGEVGETVVRRFPPRAPGRIAGVASETGLILLTLRSSNLLRLLETLDRFGAAGKELLVRDASGPFASLVLSVENVPGFAGLREELRSAFGSDLSLREGVGAVSAIGAGINATNANLAAAWSLATTGGTEPLGLSTSSFRISLLVEEPRVPDLARRIHARLVETSGAQESP